MKFTEIIDVMKKQDKGSTKESGAKSNTPTPLQKILGIDPSSLKKDILSADSYKTLQSFDLEYLYKSFESELNADLANGDFDQNSPKYMEWLRKGLINIGGKSREFRQKMWDIVLYSATLADMIAQEPDDEIKSLLFTKLTHIVDLSKAIEDFIDDTTVRERQTKLFEAIADCVTFTALNDMCAQQIQEDDADTIIISIGAGDNSEQAYPEFIKQSNLGDVSIYLFDEASEKAKLPIAHISNVETHLNGLSIYFPSNTMHFKQCTQYLERLVTLRLNRQIARYVQAINENKVKNPNLKIIFIYCCDTYIDRCVKALYDQLTNPDSGKFKPGTDLTFIHCYEAESNAVRINTNNIPEKFCRFDPYIEDESLAQSNPDPEPGIKVFDSINSVKVFSQAPRPSID